MPLSLQATYRSSLDTLHKAVAVTRVRSLGGVASSGVTLVAWKAYVERHRASCHTATSQSSDEALFIAM
jgi:hypothetical protein